MSRRTFEGPMEWEYQNQGPVDATSPFAQLSQRKQMSSFGDHSPSKFKSGPNPFAARASANPSPSKFASSQQQQQQQQHPPPPNAAFFGPQISKQFSAPPFRNPSFTTPQKRVEDHVYSEASGAEDSPAMTDGSPMPEDTPDVDRRDEFAHMTITPGNASRTLFGGGKVGGSALRSRTPGRGEVPRGSKYDPFQRDKVRKRKRQHGDRDVGSVRSRLPHESDESDSDWDNNNNNNGGSRSRATSRHGKRKYQQQQQQGKGFFGSFFAAIHDNPSVPLILSWWVQLTINVFIVSICMWGIWSFISMMRADLAHATNAERNRLMAEMQACAQEFTKNRCAPVSARLPALGKVCDEWELCMNQDPAKVMKVQVSAKNVAEVINEFVGVMSLKAWGFILSSLLIAILANNIGFGRFRETALPSQHHHIGSNNANSNRAAPALSYPSQPAGPPMLSASQDPNQAYIWAPIHTPRHLRRGIFAPDSPGGTDTDASPDQPLKGIMAAPAQTPSGRRSPSKGDRGRSPTKYGRSPSKGY